MNITFLLPRYGWYASGGFSVVYRYAGLLSQRGHQVTVVHPRTLPRGGWPMPETIYGKLHFAGGRARDLLFRPSLRWAAPDSRVRLLYVPEISEAHVPDADVVIATWWSTAEAAGALPRSKGVRFHLIQGYETWNGAEERVHAAWRAPLHKIFIARWLMERALEIGVPRDMSTLIPIAIDHGVFNVVRPIAERLRRVAMLYSPEPYKGGDIGLAVLTRAKSRIHDMDATLFGVGRAPHGLPPWIEYIRRADSERLARDVYNRSSVYLCASLSEGWHLPPAEAMACGCALVSSDIGGVRDYATDQETALLFEPGNVEEGADRLAALLTDDARRVALAESARSGITRFSWDRSADLLEDLLERHSVSGRSSHPGAVATAPTSEAEGSCPADRGNQAN